MYARLTKFVGLSEKRINDTVAGFEQGALPDLERLPGFAGVTVLVDQVRGTAAALTLWESKEAMEQSEQTALEAREQAIADAQTGPRRDPVVDHFEVILHKQAANV